ncbi:CRISPR/Cas system CSM-associated protein Csm3, group 7 of RAMP superfamily [Caldanaerobius fijiensis DSM 17918]|uniref:CRISPR/Cas system CSM-associated protein Csm3, group 7 of RAMP superfamily n=1 Tax=Caldanaerobius fijiensis DSM 17918 TaxID=1121256 RepID=A0A1M5BS46_9THEO|nr:RAMP superfamily CRISPR-associated protein [Caldanaerobius fijiensis]SHF45097.1 CRISPR/Cas system CSM-associated protein Csm3, group 7 of RAMP superfamily [Caldanaerobius fijiensis DSM 17918]
MIDARIKGRIIVEGKLILDSPLLIGSGEKNQQPDICVLKDEHGMPYIPATSFGGAIRHYFFDKAIVDEDDLENVYYFFGSEKLNKNEDNGIEKGQKFVQGATYISDLTLDKMSGIFIRDGIKINQQTGIVVDKNKFDYEIVEPGAVFNLKLEIILRECFDKEIFIKILSFIARALRNGKIYIGAMTTKGFGRVRLCDDNYYEYDYSKASHVISWLKREKGENIREKIFNTKTYSVKNNVFSIDAIFDIKSSLIIRSYSRDPDAPDAVHISCRGYNILPASSVKGALRARSLKILNSMGKDGKTLNNILFGYMSDSSDIKDTNKSKSHLIIEETYIKNVQQEIQRRIKVDRFTGGTIKSALFETMPLWRVKGSNSIVNIKLTLDNFSDRNSWEAGLLLLLLRDIWTSNLAIGGEKGIGRGILKGVSANIRVNDMKINITEKDGKIKLCGSRGESEKQIQDMLNKFVEDLVKYVPGEGEKYDE